MKLSYFIICFLVLSVLGIGTKVGFAKSNGDTRQRNYITWDDLTVDNHRFHTRDVGKNRVIVVDKNGGGDSLTVQGAVDMVPQDNAERIKIHILPGVYRFIKQWTYFRFHFLSA